MKRFVTPALLIVIAILILVLIYQNRELSTIKVQTENEDAIVRIYIALSSEQNGKEYTVEEVEKILVKHFSGATMQETVGYYKGNREKSLEITIINCCSWKESDKEFRKKVENLNEELRDKLGQKSVLVELLSNNDIDGIETIK
jgi:hypothetical protein